MDVVEETILKGLCQIAEGVVVVAPKNGDGMHASMVLMFRETAEKKRYGTGDGQTN